LILWDIYCNTQIRKIDYVAKFNYSKGDYDSLRDSCRINWVDKLSPFRNDIENMWACFIEELEDRISQFVPKKNYQVQKRCLETPTKLVAAAENFFLKIVCGQDILKHVMPVSIKNIKQCVIQSEMQHVNYRKKNNRKLLRIVGKTQKYFGNTSIVNDRFVTTSVT